MKANQKHCIKIRLFAVFDYQRVGTNKALFLYKISSLEMRIAKKNNITVGYQ